MTFGGAGTSTSSNEDSTYCHIMISLYTFGLTKPVGFLVSHFREWKNHFPPKWQPDLHTVPRNAFVTKSLAPVLAEQGGCCGTLALRLWTTWKEGNEIFWMSSSSSRVWTIPAEEGQAPMQCSNLQSKLLWQELQPAPELSWSPGHLWGDGSVQPQSAQGCRNQL